jgi:outer membrane lipoprotein LolB
MTRWSGWWLALLLLAVSGCAAPPKPAAPVDAVNGPWSGRLALQVEDRPGQSFSAGFELRGNAREGELSLFSPIGGTLAVLRWQPGSATLRRGTETREFESVGALVAHVTGEPIPIAALFDWLRGIDTPVAGWRADLTQLAQGRLAAKRLEPPPQADLRVAFDH